MRTPYAVTGVCVLIVALGPLGPALADDGAAIPAATLEDVRSLCLSNVASPPAEAEAYCSCFAVELGNSVSLETFLSFSGQGLARGQNADFGTLVRIAQTCRQQTAPAG
jgi:hypothetical protein